MLDRAGFRLCFRSSFPVGIRSRIRGGRTGVSPARLRAACHQPRETRGHDQGSELHDTSTTLHENLRIVDNSMQYRRRSHHAPAYPWGRRTELMRRLGARSCPRRASTPHLFRKLARKYPSVPWIWGSNRRAVLPRINSIAESSKGAGSIVPSEDTA